MNSKEKKKDFDCVEMKNDIQKKILKEMEGLSPKDQRSKIRQDILANPRLGSLWKKLEEKRQRINKAS